MTIIIIVKRENIRFSSRL